jgi:two-component system, response regulator
MEKREFTIVVAEDDWDDRIILEAALEAVGCLRECRFLSSGEELLDYLEQKGKYTDVRQLPNIIVLDLNEPNGCADTLRKIRGNPAVERIPVVLLIPSHEKDDVECLGSGADAFVKKPIGFDRYVQALKTALTPFFEGEIK